MIGLVGTLRQTIDFRQCLAAFDEQPSRAEELAALQADLGKHKGSSYIGSDPRKCVWPCYRLSTFGWHLA